MISPSFEPASWTIGGHRQTILGHVRRRFLRFDQPAEDRIVPTEDDARILVRASFQGGGAREDRPALLLLHGLGGSDRASYVTATARLAWAEGWHVLRMNMRGAGDGEALCPRLYNAGLDGDVLAVLMALAKELPRIVFVGFSLGGSVGLLALARQSARLPRALRGAVTISAPLDLAACARALDRTENALYQAYFMRGLRAAYRRIQRARPAFYESGRERGLATVRAFDEAITAPYGGYADADDYYARSSPGPLLHAVGLPALLLSAADDPMVPASANAHWAAPGNTTTEVWPTGGHVGFVSRAEAPGGFWGADRALAFAEQCAREEV